MDYFLGAGHVSTGKVIRMLLAAGIVSPTVLELAPAVIHAKQHRGQIYSKYNGLSSNDSMKTWASDESLRVDLIELPFTTVVVRNEQRHLKKRRFTSRG